MRTYDNGSFFTVFYSENDSYHFALHWPCSTVTGKGSFQFDKSSGDLIDATGSALEYDGPDWLVFSRTCQHYGQSKLNRS
jgi:hypothetical protein